ncbi:MAG: hypothetical protein K2N20_04800, partial [Helicobacter sp.]|nr:hypothetical protein [Helicobacter sp.]
RCYTEFMPKHADMFTGDNGMPIGYHIFAYTIEEYKQKLNRIIQDKHLRDKIGKSFTMQFEFLHKERQELCVKTFMRICQ